MHLPESLQRWTERAIGGGTELVAAEPLRPDGRPWLLRFRRAGSVVQAVVKTGDAGWRAELTTEAAALAVAEAHRLAAPRVIAADLVGDDAGALAVLFTFVDGSSHIPLDASRERMRALGAAAAELHAVPRQPCDELPLRERHMPWIDLSSERRAGEQPSTPLLDTGDELLLQLLQLPDSVATGEHPVFVHGDLWQGNTMWLSGGTYAGTIDWEAAGAGSYGVDLGSLRLDAALLHGAPGDAYDEIVAGWERASGRQAENIAYWDLVAALNTSADMSAFLPTMHQAGRTDLDGPLLTARRDAFLQGALDRLQT